MGRPVDQRYLSGGRPRAQRAPGLTSGGLWSRVAYVFGTRIAALDQIPAGITVEADGPDLLITLAAGTAAHADPLDGLLLLWDMRDSLTGRIVDFQDTALGGWQGAYNARLDVLDGLGDTQGVELGIGHVEGNGSTDTGFFAGLHDTATVTLVPTRMVSGTMTRQPDATPTGSAVAAVQIPATTGKADGSIITAGNQCFGDHDHDPRRVDVGGATRDVATGAGGAGEYAIQRYLGVYARNASGSPLGTEITYRVRPRALILDWRT